MFVFLLIFGVNLISFKVVICDSNIYRNIYSNIYRKIYRKHHYAEALPSVYMVSAKNPPPTSYLISYPFPALPPIPPHIGLQLNKLNLRWELSGLLESLHLLDLALIQFCLCHQIFSFVSPQPSDCPTRRISFGQPDNPQSRRLQAFISEHKA